MSSIIEKSLHSKIYKKSSGLSRIKMFNFSLLILASIYLFMVTSSNMSLYATYKTCGAGRPTLLEPILQEKMCASLRHELHRQFKVLDFNSIL